MQHYLPFVDDFNKAIVLLCSCALKVPCLLCADLPAQLRQEDGSREKYQRFFDEMDKDGSKTIEYARPHSPLQMPHRFAGAEQLANRMVELAARHGYEMDGKSLLGSLEESISSSSKFSEHYPSAFRKKRDHKGMSADNMKRIFATLVRRSSEKPRLGRGLSSSR